MPRATVKFRKNKGTISIEVTSGFASLGSFVLAYKKKGDPEYTEFGKDPKRIDDDVPDLFMIPVDEGEIENYRVVIMGKYAPGPGHSQVKVTYSFIQQNKIIHETSIEKTPSHPFLRTNHRYVFEPV